MIFHESLSLENIRYGMRVYVLGIPCHDKWRTEKRIKIAGPEYLGYDVEYAPVEELMIGILSVESP